MKVLGLDIGNAKIKMCFVESTGSLREESVRWLSRPLPVSTNRKRDFEVGVPSQIRMAGALFGFEPGALDAVVVCSSNSYSFPLLHESVSHLAPILTETFGSAPVFLVTVDGRLTPVHQVQTLGPEALSAHVLTNFYGSAWLGSRLIRDGISIDIGTTSTEIVPIVGGVIDPVGLVRPSDYLRFRYQHSRLAWYGVTWTPLSMIASEVVAQSGTYQVVARNHRTDLIFALHDEMDPELMREHAYFPFPDRHQALAGLCEFVGLDRRLLEESEILAVRGFLYDRLIDKVAALASAVARETFQQPPAQLEVALFALGEHMLARPALIRAGFDPRRICTLSLGRAHGLWSASSAFAMALLGLESALGHRVEVT